MQTSKYNAYKKVCNCKGQLIEQISMYKTFQLNMNAVDEACKHLLPVSLPHIKRLVINGYPPTTHTHTMNPWTYTSSCFKV